MKLESIHVKNFRLLRDVSIQLTSVDQPTVLVGPNNSGKTSVMDAFSVFLSPKDGITHSIHDISIEARSAFQEMEKDLKCKGASEECINSWVQRAPKLCMDLVFKYDEESSDLAIASSLLMNLDVENTRVALRIEISLSVDGANRLYKNYDRNKLDHQSLFKFLAGDFTKYYKRRCYKCSVNRETGMVVDGDNEVLVLDDSLTLSHLIKVDRVSAQRFVDDAETNRATRLSQLLHNYYNRSLKNNDPSKHKAIANAIEKSATDLSVEYRAIFDKFIKTLQLFGYPHGYTAPEMDIRAELNPDHLFQDSTHIYYTALGEVKDGDKELRELPERFSGLGYKNLVYMVLMLSSFLANLEEKDEPYPAVHVIMIEEPEAYLHPQMQTVFVKNIIEAAHRECNNKAQLVISTHSSHIVSGSNIWPIRYFHRTENEVEVKDLAKLPIKEEMWTFLRRYMRDMYCDLFFANKVIFVEGQVERLLLPSMLRKYDALSKHPRLSAQYISIAEVGGAYAHKFAPLIEFIDVPTLVITDIDTGDPENNEKKCQPCLGTVTSNQSLCQWIPKVKSYEDLMAATDEDKTRNNIRVTYQVPETEVGNCARSFEEAFVLCNLKWLDEVPKDKMPATGKAIGTLLAQLGEGDGTEVDYGKIGKTDFAIDLVALGKDEDWKIPRYIYEGLEWLAQQGADR